LKLILRPARGCVAIEAVPIDLQRHEARYTIGKDIELSQRALIMDPKYFLPRQSIAISHDKLGKNIVRTDPKAAPDPVINRSPSARRSPSLTNAASETGAVSASIFWTWEKV
jgi:hypothetical protein